MGVCPLEILSNLLICFIYLEIYISTISSVLMSCYFKMMAFSLPCETPIKEAYNGISSDEHFSKVSRWMEYRYPLIFLLYKNVFLLFNEWF